jgi:hypothetical protein
MGDRWTPGIGDPTFLGWAAVFGYFTAAALCLAAGVRERRSALAYRTGASEWLLPEFWFVLAVALGLLGINKQLDLQTWFTQVGRDIATYGGWYESRRPVQAVFVVVVGGCGLSVMWATYRYVCGSWERYRLGYYGIVYLASFVIIRAASFHHLDVLLKTGRLGIHINHLLEFAGIGTTAYGAWRAALHDVRPFSGRASTRQSAQTAAWGSHR